MNNSALKRRDAPARASSVAILSSVCFRQSRRWIAARRGARCATYNDRRVCGAPYAGAAARARTVFSALERSRSMTVLIRTTWKPQSARQPIPATSNRSMSVPHCDDALQKEGTNRHGHNTEEDERVARRGREEGLHV